MGNRWIYPNKVAIVQICDSSVSLDKLLNKQKKYRWSETGACEFDVFRLIQCPWIVANISITITDFVKL